MDAEQIQALIDAGFTNANNSSSAVLIFMGAFMGLVTVIISLSLVFVVIRLLAVQTLFINQMTVRAVMANEQSRQSTDTQTTAMMGQTRAMSDMNATGIATGAAVAGVDRKTSLLLGLAEIMGVDIKNLAQNEVAPTAATQKKVEAIADKPAGDTVVGEPEKPAPTTPKPGDEIPVTGVVTLTGATADTPA